MERILCGLGGRSMPLCARIARIAAIREERPSGCPLACSAGALICAEGSTKTPLCPCLRARGITDLGSGSQPDPYAVRKEAS
ncbi:hypothetical protein MesoLjLc_03420 [Mesorhizobium sp. L-8-10]|nr:hypothetical protein MesoLjLc_03420 [Mesorhizobium sp. L-8-10]